MQMQVSLPLPAISPTVKEAAAKAPIMADLKAGSTSSMGSSTSSSPKKVINQITEAPTLTRQFVDDLGDHSLLLRNPRFTKSTAYTQLERQKLGLEGLLPSAVETLAIQIERNYNNMNYFSEPLSKYIFLSTLRDRNETIYFALVKKYIKEVLPIIYTPTVGQACMSFGSLYRHAEGMYVSLHDNIERILDNWNPSAGMDEQTRTQPGIIVLTDGSRILGLGDLGVNGMGIPIGKLSLYAAVGGFHPLSLLPICVDVGTNNSKLLEDPFYMGTRRFRPEKEVYRPFMGKLIKSLSAKWPDAVIQFEDIENAHCFDLLEEHRYENRLFNDDIQGTGVVAAAAVISAMRLIEREGVALEDHKMVFYGFGSAAAGVASQIVECIHARTGAPREGLRDMFYMVDSKGLVTTQREVMADYKRPYAQRRHSAVEGMSLEDVVLTVKPTFLFGLAGQDGGAFTETIVKSMAENQKRPAIFALSNPTSKAELLFEDAMNWTKGRVIYCSGSPMDPFNGQTCSQCNNLYAFPGIGFGAWLGQVSNISDGMITAVANEICEMTTNTQLKAGLLFPPMEEVCEVSDACAVALIVKAQEEDLCMAELAETPAALLRHVKAMRYKAKYPKWITPSN